MFKAINIVGLEAKDVQRGGEPVVRVPNRVIREGTITRGQAVIIESAKGKTLRFALGVGRPRDGFDDRSIAIDYDAKRELGVIDAKSHVTVHVRPATGPEIWGWYYRHPDLQVRMSIRLAALGAVLGGVGVVLGALSVVLTLA